jgi:hypothetical protein
LVMKGQAVAAAAASGPGHPSGPSAAAAAVEDDDIFGEAGTDYKPALPQKQDPNAAR